MLKEISIEIIRKCPNYCLHCSSSASPQCSEIMSYDKFTEVVRDAKTLGATTICLSGGEPFLHSDIKKMIEFVHSNDMKCYIYTSGIIFDEFGKRTFLSKELLKDILGKATKLIFNIEAATENTYNEIMGTNGCFDFMKKSVINASDLGICTEAHFVPMSLNIHEINEVIVLCQKLNVSKISFLRLVLHGRAIENKDKIAINAVQNDNLKTYLKNIQNESYVSVRIGVPLSLDSLCHKCEAANGKLNIKYDGEVFPCEVFKNYSMNSSFHGLCPDNINTNSLLNIYCNSPYLSFVRDLSTKFSKTCPQEPCIGQYLIELESERKFNDE